MQPMLLINVVPSLPEALLPLRELAYNLWWSWNPEAIELFRRLSRDAWEKSGHNPVRLLGMIEQERLNSLATDDGLLAHLGRVHGQLQRYMTTTGTWYARNCALPVPAAKGKPSSAPPTPRGAVAATRDGVPTAKRGSARAAKAELPPPSLAYFCFEFGLTECLPIYSGGMGVLAGDYLKSASDLGLPMVAVGLFYQQGYFRQYLNADGWQGETYEEIDFHTVPAQLEKRNGVPVTIELDYPGRRVTAQVWRVQVGRVALYLLDTNVAQNQPEDRHITHQLYGGDNEMRIRQEIMLGIGGLKALRALGIRPQVCHMNEGHAAFLAIERIRQMMEEQGLTFAEAKEVVAASSVFTTHTSVPAGIDLFAPYLIDRYLGYYYDLLHISRFDFLALGRQDPNNQDEPLNMAVLALRLAAQTNAVSHLHGKVSRELWQGIWPGVPEWEVPIVAINNGVHTRSWISQDLAALFDRYLGPRWTERPADLTVWEAVDEIPDEELWRVHERRRARLVAFARHRLHSQLEQRGSPPAEVARAAELLDPEALTIGFARRFAVYKRATLLLRNAERLATILNDAKRPVQVIFAGKAHPQDNPAKELIRQLTHLLRNKGLNNVVFIEDYDINLGRYLMQGVDVWLNNPRLMQEASGTSGMKAAANGALNLSALDGWWAEAYHPEIGWAIGRGEVYDDLNYQDEVESNAIYDLLEKEIVPLFYSRAADGLPRGWIARMKNAMQTVIPMYNTNRMVMEYSERLYQPATARYARLLDRNFQHAKSLAEWKAHLYQHWPEVRIVGIETDAKEELPVNSEFEVRASLNLGELGPDDVSVELYGGALDADQDIVEGRSTPLSYGGVRRGVSLFVGKVRFQQSGLRGYTLRVLPRHEDLANPFEPRLILWGA